ncbi:hypothetical protein ACXYTP_25275 [Tsukamurella ocularis]
MSDIDGLDLHRCMTELLALRGRQGKHVVELRNAEQGRKEAFRELERAAAKVRAGTVGTVQAKQDAVTLDEHCQALQDAFDVAETAENYSKRMANAEREDISILQTVAGLIRQALSLAGVADRHP